MIVSVYLIAAPGMDRVCVQTIPPSDLNTSGGTRVYRVEVDLPDVCKTDGVIRVQRKDVERFL